jgi:hypothetical protein
MLGLMNSERHIRCWLPYLRSAGRNSIYCNAAVQEKRGTVPGQPDRDQHDLSNTRNYGVQALKRQRKKINRR